MHRNMVSINRKCRTDSNTWEYTNRKGRKNLSMLNGYWIWWCYTHSQPLPWCKLERSTKEADGQ